MSTVEASSAQFSILRRPLENGATLEGSLCQLCQFSNFVQFVFYVFTFVTNFFNVKLSFSRLFLPIWTNFLNFLPILKRKIEFFAPFFANFVACMKTTKYSVHLWWQVARPFCMTLRWLISDMFATLDCQPFPQFFDYNQTQRRWKKKWNQFHPHLVLFNYFQLK